MYKSPIAINPVEVELTKSDEVLVKISNDILVSFCNFYDIRCNSDIYIVDKNNINKAEYPLHSQIIAELRDAKMRVKDNIHNTQSIKSKIKDDCQKWLCHFECFPGD